MYKRQQYAIAVAKEEVADSGLDVEKEDLNRIGVIFGAGIGGIHTFEAEVGNYYTRQEMGPKFNPFFIPKMISDIAAGQISIMYGFQDVYKRQTMYNHTVRVIQARYFLGDSQLLTTKTTQIMNQRHHLAAT